MLTGHMFYKIDIIIDLFKPGGFFIIYYIVINDT